MPSIAIIGGGYAGLRAAKRLDALLDARWSITLYDRLSSHELITRLPKIISGSIDPDLARVPLNRVLGGRIVIRRTTVSKIDTTKRTLETTEGTEQADRLVVTVGGTPDFLDVPGAAEYALVFRTVKDALALRDRLRDAYAKRRATRIVIVGAGYTGTEVAGELAEPGAEVASDHERPEITLVAADFRVLPDGNPKLARVAEDILRKKGVRFMLGLSAERVEPNALFAGGRKIDADIILWAAHTRASTHVLAPGVREGRDGRIVVDPYLRAEGMNHVYVAGDASLTYDYRRDRVVPMSAQLAVREGDLVGENLAAEVQGRPLREFRPHSLGEALSLGGNDGVAEVAGLVISGRAALAAKEAALVRYLVSLGGIRLSRAYV